MAGTHDQRAVDGEFALATLDGLLDQFGSANVGVHGSVGLRHVVPVGLRPSPPNVCVAVFIGALQRKNCARLCQKSRVLGKKHSVPGWRRLAAAATGEQLGNVGGVELVALVAELAVDLHRPALLFHQLRGIGRAQADQGIGRALA
ncbi:hypothetical protein D9M71_210700 [compost metagenome]